jgi:hypothetical protein
MAKITDPDNLTQGGEIVIDSTTRTIQLRDGTGNLTTEGVSMITLYSFLKEEWKDDAALIKFPFPIIAITPEQFEFFNGWTYADTNTRNLFRDGGFAVKAANGNSTQEFMGFTSLGTLVDSTDQIYYQQEIDGTSTDVVLTGPANQCVQVMQDTNADGTPDWDFREYFKAFVREEQKLFDSAQLSDIGVTTMTYQVYRFPLTNAVDLKIAVLDSAIDTTGNGVPDGTAIIDEQTVDYTDMSITYLKGTGFKPWDTTTHAPESVVQDATFGRWYYTQAGGDSTGTDADLDGGSDLGVDWVPFAGERQTGGTTWYPFTIIVDADVNTGDGLPKPFKQRIYEFTQFQLRQSLDIDDGTGIVIGKTADTLLSYVGDTLVTATGVWIDDFNADDTNDIEFYDAQGTQRLFPYVATGTLNFNDNLADDGTDAIYRMFYSDLDATANSGDEFGTTGATLVIDNDGTAIAGIINGFSQVQFTYDYDGNTQRPLNQQQTPAAVTVVAIGLGRAQYVLATGTIARSKTNSISLVAALERNYLNPL